MKDLTEMNDSLCKKLSHFKVQMKDLTFSYECLETNSEKFFHMSGLTVDDYNCLFECIEPYVSVIVYPHCKNNTDWQRKLTKKTELLCFLTICRHALHLRITAFFTNTSDVTM